MQCTLHSSPAADVLVELYADSELQDAKAKDRPKSAPPLWSGATPLERFTSAKHLYMPIDRPFGHLLYSLIRASRPLTIVEFGTSFGISTIFLAAAARDNGAGKVITTEFLADKAEVAKKNLTAAGLADWVEFRVGDAIHTLHEPLPGPVDFLFLDGEKTMYLDVVKLLEPRMKPGCLIASDNTDQQGTHTYLNHVRDAGNGYISAPLLTPGGPKHQSGHELSVRL